MKKKIFKAECSFWPKNWTPLYRTNADSRWARAFSACFKIPIVRTVFCFLCVIVKWSEWVSRKSLPRSILPRVSTPFPAGCEVKWVSEWSEWVSEVSEWSEWVSEWSEWVNPKCSLNFYETYICYSLGIHITWYIGTVVQNKSLMGFKVRWSWGSRIFFLQNPLT